MQVNSLGYKTDLIFPAFDGEIIDRGEYLAVKTPSNPGFYWGNFLFFPRPPNDGDCGKWCRLFDEEIGTRPDFHHKAFGWDSIEGESGVLQPFFDKGFQLKREAVLTASQPLAVSTPSNDLNIRILSSESDWHQALENQLACRNAEFEESRYQIFRENQIPRYRKMAQAGHGDWYGVFLDNRLVADLGVFHGDGIGRFQMVETHPDFRRRGIATALVSTAANQALLKYDLKMLVIVTEDASAAQRMYESVGFLAVEYQMGIAKWPPT